MRRSDFVDCHCMRAETHTCVPGRHHAVCQRGILLRIMSPTVFREDGFRFYFFSREEPRMHVHVHCSDGEAKFWMEPFIELAQNSGMSERQVRAALTLVEVHADEIRSAWQQHFGT